MMHFFGTDGIRGIFGKPPLTPEPLQAIGRGMALSVGKGGHIVIGYDTRASCAAILEALCSGLCDVSVTVLGVVPTPAVAFMTRHMGADMGLMISASHNPHMYNGLKFFTRAGEKLTTLEESLLEHSFLVATSNGAPCVVTQGDSRPYCEALVALAPSLSGLKVALDCAHGAFSSIAANIFRACRAEVVCVMGNAPNGSNINDGVGSTEPKALQAAVVESGADLGIAFDGDGDRVVFVDHQGHLHDGDQLLALLALEEGKGVVGTVMSNLGLEHFCKEKNIPFTRSPVGDRFVAQDMKERGWLLGGESCGHVVVGKHLMTGDGIAAALVAAKLFMEHGGRGVFPIFQPCPSALYNVKVHSCGKTLLQVPLIQEQQELLNKALEGRGRVLVRPSGTEPLIRILLEGEALEEVLPMVDALVEQLHHYDALPA